MTQDKENTSYGIRLAIIYAMVWFMDLLDASTLNVALPSIAQAFQVDPTNMEWTVVGFLLSMTIGISISGWLGDNFGTKAIFLLSQVLYLGSSIGCGLSAGVTSLVSFRIIQGFAGGLAIPLGMSALIKALPKSRYAKTTASINMVTLFAPALGPIFGSYVTSLWGWRWIFFLKLPLAFICFAISLLWVRKDTILERSKFDWPGFVLSSLSLIGILWTFSEVGKSNSITLILIAGISILLGILFLKREKVASSPLVPLALFKIPQYSYGNLIQSAANTIFLGANFIIALYLQQGLKYDLLTAGWVLAAITPGLLLVQPIVGRFYNQIGPLPFILFGLSALSLCTLCFAFTTPNTSPYFLAFLVFCIGAASAMAQSANVTSIMSAIPQQFKGPGSSVYSLCKQISASFGVALSSVVLSLGITIDNEPTLSAFHYSFITLSLIPAAALYFCKHLRQGDQMEFEPLNASKGA